MSVIQDENDNEPLHTRPEDSKSREQSSIPQELRNNLTSQSTVEDFTIGTGRTIFTAALLPAILSARHEIILATCFWARGPTLDSLHQTLKQLSDQVIARGEPHKIKVYICLSSRSIYQKLVHTGSRNGYTYPPSSWSDKLGLPSPEEIPGLQLTVKSLFFRPFSVLHSKYLIVDRNEVWFPSCNVSWEEWFECCVHLRGQIVDQAFSLWQEVWFPLNEAFDPQPQSSPCRFIAAPEPDIQSFNQTTYPSNTIIPTTLLPHPHNTSIRSSLWFLPSHLNPPPQTPLNTALLHLFAHATKSITIVTPNFTSFPAYTALLTALEDGVNIHLITNRCMMLLEQLITSGTITEWWIWRLKRAYGRLLARGGRQSDNPSALESAQSRMGSLRIDIFSPSTGSGAGVASAATKSHVKLTVVDGEVAVLGSGNMDRASWFTSQEVGVMLHGEHVVRKIWEDVQAGLEGCLERYL